MQTLREAAEEAKRQAAARDKTRGRSSRNAAVQAPASASQPIRRQADHPSADDVVVRDENGQILIREEQLRQPKAGPVVREAAINSNMAQQADSAKLPLNKSANSVKLPSKWLGKRLQQQHKVDQEKRRRAEEHEQRKRERAPEERQEQLEQQRREQRRQPKRVTARLACEAFCGILGTSTRRLS